MGRAIIGRKIGMTQVFDEDGTVHPVTVIEAGGHVMLFRGSTQPLMATKLSRSGLAQ